MTLCTYKHLLPWTQSSMAIKHHMWFRMTEIWAGSMASDWWLMIWDWIWWIHASSRANVVLILCRIVTQQDIFGTSCMFSIRVLYKSIKSKRGICVGVVLNYAYAPSRAHPHIVPTSIHGLVRSIIKDDNNVKIHHIAHHPYTSICTARQIYW